MSPQAHVSLDDGPVGGTVEPSGGGGLNKGVGLLGAQVLGLIDEPFSQL